MKKIAICVLLSSVLFSCGGNVNSNADLGDASSVEIGAGGVTWLKKSTRGFEAVVDGSFSITDMQKTFGSYCNRNNKVTRSLRMEPYGSGQQRVIGACL